MADDKTNESLSALIDGEMDEHEMVRFIRELQHEAQQQQTWQRYHLIGDALRKNLPAHIDGSFASRVSQAIVAEDIHSTTVVKFKPKPNASLQSHSTFSKPLAGFALAASVAAVAYLGVGMIAVDEQVSAPHLASNVLPLSSPVIQPATLDGFQTVQGQRWNVDTPAVESRLNSYLQNHNTLSSVTAMNSLMLPNVRLVETQPAQGE